MQEKIRKCKYCGSDIKIKPGLQNWKNLFRKPTLEDWITLIIVLMLIISAYAYKSDIQTLNNFYQNESSCNINLNNLDEEINIDEIIHDTLLNTNSSLSNSNNQDG